MEWAETGARTFREGDRPPERGEPQAPHPGWVEIPPETGGRRGAQASPTRLTLPLRVGGETSWARRKWFRTP